MGIFVKVLEYFGVFPVIWNKNVATKILYEHTFISFSTVYTHIYIYIYIFVLDPHNTTVVGGVRRSPTQALTSLKA